MDAGRQILRYSIPGAVLLLHAVLLHFVFRTFQGAPPSETSGAVSASIGPIVAVLATIPVGFIVYQLYYFNYAPTVKLVPRRWKSHLVRRDRGAEVLAQLPSAQLHELREVFGAELDIEEVHEEVPKASLLRHPAHSLFYRLHLLQLSDDWNEDLEESEREKRFCTRWYENWDVMRALVDVAGADANTQLKQEYTTLSDLYHAIGASRAAVVIAFFVAAIDLAAHPTRIGDHPVGSASGFAAIFAISLALWWVFHRARGNTWRSASRSLGLGLRWFYFNRQKLVEQQPVERRFARE